MKRWSLLVAAALIAPSCQSLEGECHRQARAQLRCCPFCDEECAITKDVEAQLALQSCLDVSADPSQHEPDEDGDLDDAEPDPEVGDEEEPTEPDGSSAGA